jgi:hypothetical protein
MVPGPPRQACQSQVVRFYSVTPGFGVEKRFVDGTNGGWIAARCLEGKEEGVKTYGKHDLRSSVRLDNDLH